MGTRRVNALASLMMVVAMLVGGLWAPASAQEEPAAATPAVTDVTPEETPTEAATEAAEEAGESTPADEDTTPEESGPAVAPARTGAPRIQAATGTVTFGVSTSDNEPVPTNFKLCVVDATNAPQCSEPGEASWTVDVVAGTFYYYTEFQEPYLEIDVYNVPIAAGQELDVPVVLEMAQMVEVTFTVATTDGGDVPAGLQICTSDAVNPARCSEPGVTEWTVEVLSQRFSYWTQFTDEYIDIWVDDATLPAGEPATIEILLEPDPVLETNITKTVSEPNPAPGSQVTYTVHAWGTSPHSAVEIQDFLPRELSDPTFSCEIAVGSAEWSDSCDGWWIPFANFVYGGIDPDDQGKYDVTFTVTATVPDEPGVSFVNTACAYGERATFTAQRSASDPIAGEECAAASVVTAMETEPALVTVNVTTADGSALPAGTAICVSTPVMVEPACAAPGSASGTFDVAAGSFFYTVLAPGYAPVRGSGEVAAGDEAVVNVELAAEDEVDLHITKTASDENPMPGDRISYEIHVWGSTPSQEPISFVDLVPAELSEVRVSCELIVGWTNDPSCAYPQDGVIVGSIVPDDYNDDSDDFEMIVTVTGTVPDEQGVTFTNLACALPSEEPVVTERQGVRAFAQQLPALGSGACAAATVTTQSDPEPAEGQWGTAALTADKSEAKPGETVTYTLTLPWIGSEAAPQVMRQGVMGFAQIAGPSFVIRDPVPDLLTNVVWTCAAENATCSPALGSGYDVTAEGEVLDPAQDALITLTITGTVVPEAEAGRQIVNQACVTQEVNGPVPPAPPVRCDQELFAVVVVAGASTPTPTPSPTPVGPTATPSPTGTPDPVQPTATPGATATATPGVTGLPSTGAAPGAGGSAYVLLALAAALLGAGAVGLRGARARR